MSSNDSMLDVYIYENTQLLEEFESLLIPGEKNGSFTEEQVASILRILHTVKGSSAMMNFDNISNLSHGLEDLYIYLRENSAQEEQIRKICDFSFKALDVINEETAKIQTNGMPDGDVSDLLQQIKSFYETLKSGTTQTQKTSTIAHKAQSNSIAQISGSHYYKATVFFEEDCKMENVRALGIVKSVEVLCSKIITRPEDLLNENSDEEIGSSGFTLYMQSDASNKELCKKIKEAFFVKTVDFNDMSSKDTEIQELFGLKPTTKTTSTTSNTPGKATDHTGVVKQKYLSVSLQKLDKLMDLVGEIVISESTVTKNPEVLALGLDSFTKASRQLRKLTDELQDIVMSIRMIPVSATFLKMERIVRDMSNKIGKKANLTIIGEETELDKNVIDMLSDPLMHIIRNAMDHGIESEEDRIKLGKDPVGQIVLEARNTSGNVSIIISDDGKGLNKQALIKKGMEQGLITKPESEVTDQEAYSLIFKSGFSTKKKVTEFSGRGVGMDVALNNIEKMGGAVNVDSKQGEGMRVEIQIPLTLAIIDGMQVSVGNNTYIIPLLSIKESFKPNMDDVITDPSGNQMIHMRGNCYPIVKLHELFKVDTDITDLEDGILVLIQSKSQDFCLFVDKLLGEQQTVVKPIPNYISRALGDVKSLAGCTILGDGSISLILDINGLLC